LALNYADGKLYYKNSSGVVTLLASATTVTNSFSAGTTGFTPSTATTGAVTLAGTLITSNGGTGLASYTAGDLSYFASGTALTKLAIGTAGQILTSSGTAPQWSTLSGVAVTTLSFGTTGLTPSTATSGAITVAGTLVVGNGGTGLTSLTAGYIPFGAGTSAFGNSANLFWDNTNTRLGLGTATPVSILNATFSGGAVSGTHSMAFGIPYAANLQLKSTNAGTSVAVASVGLYGNPERTREFAFYNQATDARVGYLGYQYGSGGVITDLGLLNALAGALTFGTNNTEVGRFASTGQFGIGETSPQTYGKLVVRNDTASGAGTGAASSIWLLNANATANNSSTIFFGDNAAAAAGAINFVNTDHATDYGQISFDTNGSGGYGTRFIISELGALGVSTTPNRWFSNRAAMQFGGSVGAISMQNGYEIGVNFYVAETTATDKRVQAGYANKVASDASVGDIVWSTAGTSTGGSNITWSERMRLLNAGGLAINGTTAPRLLTITGGGASISLNDTNGGIYMGTGGSGGGGFASNSAIARASTAGFHIGSSQVGDLCIAPEGGANIRFGYSASGATSTNTAMTIGPTGVVTTTGNLSVGGALSKASGSFRIEHPLPQLAETHQLVHSFIESPQADLIYRGKVNLVAGTATVNIDTAAGMTEGTFVVLCRDVQCFTTNESDWTAVRGSVSGNILTIEAQDQTSTSSISWMVIGERQDKHMYDTDWTDDNGKVIVEPLKPIED
jgi:hypothetical protein